METSDAKTCYNCRNPFTAEAGINRCEACRCIRCNLARTDDQYCTRCRLEVEDRLCANCGSLESIRDSTYCRRCIRALQDTEEPPVYETMFPIRCYTSNTLLADKEASYRALIAAGYSPEEAMDTLGIGCYTITLPGGSPLKRYRTCCRRDVLSPIAVVHGAPVPSEYDANMSSVMRGLNRLRVEEPRTATLRGALNALSVSDITESPVQTPSITPPRSTTAKTARIAAPMLKLPPANPKLALPKMSPPKTSPPKTSTPLVPKALAPPLRAPVKATPKSAPKIPRLNIINNQ